MKKIFKKKYITLKKETKPATIPTISRTAAFEATKHTIHIK